MSSLEDGHGRGGGLGLRATVDGNARRRRPSSDEDSVKELSAAQESHLQSYQLSTPMQPGVCVCLCVSMHNYVCLSITRDHLIL